MLPDWPEAKDKIGEAFLRFIRAETMNRLGFLAEVKNTVAHEGDGMSISRADGSQSDQEFTQLGAEMAIPTDEFVGLRIPAILQRLRGVADDLARARSEHAFSVLDATCQEAGNVVDAEGNPISAELILKTWETMEFGFDENGQPQLPTIVVAPSQREAVAKACSELETDPELKRRADEIIQRKREQWLAREANRTLVG